MNEQARHTKQAPVVIGVEAARLPVIKGPVKLGEVERITLEELRDRKCSNQREED